MGWLVAPGAVRLAWRALCAVPVRFALFFQFVRFANVTAPELPIYLLLARAKILPGKFQVLGSYCAILGSCLGHIAWQSIADVMTPATPQTTSEKTTSSARVAFVIVHSAARCRQN